MRGSGTAGVSQRVRRNIEYDLLTLTAQGRRTHPAHGWVTLQKIAGVISSLQAGYPDDPALAAPMILERVDTVIGMLQAMKRWALAVNDCEPHECPTTGARIRR